MSRIDRSGPRSTQVFSRRDAALERCAALERDAGSDDVAGDASGCADFHSLVAVQISFDRAIHGDEPRSDIRLDAAALADRQMMPLMRDLALDRAFDDQVFIERKLTTLDGQRGS